MEKLHEYQGWQGRIHEWRDGIREKISNWREQNPGSIVESIKTSIANKIRSDVDPNDYSHIYRLVNMVKVCVKCALNVRICVP